MTHDVATHQRAGIEHTSVATGRRYDDLVRAFEHEVRYLDPAMTQRLVERKASWSDVEREIGQVGEPHGLMIVARVDLGGVTSLSGRVQRCSSYLVGNPVIANEVITVDIRGSFYVPFRVALYDDGSPDGAAIAYDRPSSLLAALGRPELSEIGESLNRKIDAVATAVIIR